MQVSKKFDNNFGIYGSLTSRALIYFQEGNYDASLKAHQESLSYRKMYNELLSIFRGYFNIFDFYYSRFKVTQDRKFMTQAADVLIDLEELRKANPDEITVVNYTKYAQALVLKVGNFRKKAKAGDLFEELLDIYPSNIDIYMNFLELLFEDVLTTEDEDTIAQINELMDKVKQIPLRNNSEAIFNFISQQILLAKYNYYIRGDVSLALQILHNVRDKMTTYELFNVVNELEREIHVFEREMNKWENMDLSIRERINASEMRKYIQNALGMAKKLT